MSIYYTYILLCEDGSYYTGITTDLRRREAEHLAAGKKSAGYTRSHRAVRMLGAWQSESRSAALKLEFRIKQLTKPQKEKLISENDLSAESLLRAGKREGVLSGICWSPSGTERSASATWPRVI